MGPSLFYEKPLTVTPLLYIIILLWRCNSVGQSSRFIPDLSLVRIQSPLPFRVEITDSSYLHSISFCPLRRLCSGQVTDRHAFARVFRHVLFRITWQIQIPYEPIIDHDPLSSVLTSSQYYSVHNGIIVGKNGRSLLSQLSLLVPSKKPGFPGFFRILGLI